MDKYIINANAKPQKIKATKNEKLASKISLEEFLSS